LADTSDVENEFVTLVTAVIYPNGTALPSIVNTGVKIFRGWPNSAGLDADLAAGLANVSIFPPPGLERNTTRYPRQNRRLAKPVHTLTATVNGNTITIGGTVAVPQNVIALCGNRFAFPYGVQANDTLDAIATNLASLIAVKFPGTQAAGNIIAVAGNPGILQARIASTAQVATEQSLQEKTYWITCWCPTPAMRDILAPAIDVALKQLDFIVVGTEQSRARIRYARSNTSDEGQKVQIYRRDIVYTVEFGTYTIATAFETGVIGFTSGPIGPIIVTTPEAPGEGELDYSDADNTVLDVSL
jgi:hypothetical protein